MIPFKRLGHIFVHGEDTVPKWRGLVAGSMVEFILYFDGGRAKKAQKLKHHP